MTQKQFFTYLDDCQLGFKDKIEGRENLPDTLELWTKEWDRFMQCKEPEKTIGGIPLYEYFAVTESYRALQKIQKRWTKWFDKFMQCNVEDRWQYRDKLSAIYKEACSSVKQFGLTISDPGCSSLYVCQQKNSLDQVGIR